MDVSIGLQLNSFFLDVIYYIHNETAAVTQLNDKFDTLFENRKPKEMTDPAQSTFPLLEFPYTPLFRY